MMAVHMNFVYWDQCDIPESSFTCCKESQTTGGSVRVSKGSIYKPLHVIVHFIEKHVTVGRQSYTVSASGLGFACMNCVFRSCGAHFKLAVWFVAYVGNVGL